MNIKEIKIPSLGYEIKADWYDNNSDTIILCLNGRTATRGSFGYMIKAIVEETGFNALQIDYSGHGDSPFDWQEISAAEQFIEVVKAFDWIKSNYPNKKIYVFGTSFGGYLATQLVKYRNFEKLVLAAPAIYPADSFYAPAKDTHDDTDGTVSPVRRDKQQLLNHPLLKRASQKFNNPVLVVVHENDESIPATTTDAYAEAFNADELIIKDLPHSTEDEGIPADKIEEYQGKIAGWLKL